MAAAGRNIRNLRAALLRVTVSPSKKFASWKPVRDLHLQGKTAIMTGSTTGLGLSIAVELAREGVKVFVAGRTQPKIYEALKIVRRAGDAEGVVANADTADGCAALIKQVPRPTSW